MPGGKVGGECRQRTLALTFCDALRRGMGAAREKEVPMSTLSLPQVLLPALPRRPAPRLCAWRARLPPGWRAHVVPPRAFCHYREHEMAAERVLGYDAEGQPCYTAYRFSLIEPRSDDGEAFYVVLAYGEELMAWRLDDACWLVWREIWSEECCDAARGFYSLARAMPR